MPAGRMTSWQKFGGRLSSPVARLLIAGMMVVALAVVGIAGLYEFNAGDARRDATQRQADQLRPRVAALLAALSDPVAADRMPVNIAALRRWGETGGAALRLPGYDALLRDLDQLAALGALRPGDPRLAQVLTSASRLLTDLDGLAGMAMADRADARERLVRLLTGCLIGLIIVAGLGIVPMARGLLRRGGAFLMPQGPSGRGLDRNYAAALDAMSDGVAVFDMNDRLLFCNTAFRDVYEMPDDPIPADAHYETIFRGAAVKGRFAAVQHDEVDWLAHRFAEHRKPSSRATLSLADRRSLELEERKTDAGWTIVVQRDVTEYGRREAARRTAEAKARSIVDSVFDGVVTVDAGGIIDTVNKRAEEIFGYESDRAVGRGVGLLMPGTDIAALLTEESVAAGGLREVAGRRQNGQDFPLEFSVTELQNTWSVHDRRRAARRQLLFTLRDVSQQRALSQQVQQAQKMDALGTLAGGIAHDFNNILSIIMGYGSLLQQELPPGTEARDNAEMIAQAARRAKDLVEQILTFSRRTDLERKPLDPKPVVKEVLKLIRSTVPASIRIEQEVDAAETRILADPTQLQQVVMNLCTNAAQALGDQAGSIRVVLRPTFVDGSEPSTAGVKPGAYLHLAVADDGAGIAPAIQERIFEPFFTTKPRGQGTGLGLSVVHGIVVDSGGAIRLTSTAGAGTRFDIYWPLHEGLVEAEAVLPAVATPAGRARILFVDDELLIVRMGQRALGRLGYTVTGLTDPEEALQAFQDAPDSFDLIITDQTMPAMTGDALIAALREISPGLPAILCTGYSPSMNADEARRRGIEAFLMKPLEADDLGRAVATVLARARSSGVAAAALST